MIATFFAKTVAMKVIVWGVFAALLALPAVGWGAYKIGHHQGGEVRDGWWRANLAESNSEVKEAMATGNGEAKATDEQLIEKIGEQDADLHEVEQQLEQEKNKPPRVVYVREPEPDVCPRIPARCVAP